MKKYGFILLILIPLFCVGQKNKYSFFGIDLDSDWNTLTNQQVDNRSQIELTVKNLN